VCVPQCGMCLPGVVVLRKLSIATVLALATAARADFIDLYANKTDMPLNKGPRIGRSRVVVIPVQIDFGTYQAVDMARLHAFFDTGLSGDAVTFSKYFSIASGGRYTAEATLAPLVRYNG